jgi:leucyl/phenylalanyl-tRNA---protein transferase
MPTPASQPPLPWLSPGDAFPAPCDAWGPNSPAPGLLAAGGDLEPATLIQAYRKGIFPWFSTGEPLLWWCTQPRMVLDPDRFRLSDSLRKQIRTEWRRGNLRITFDSAFPDVIRACASIPRQGQAGTWITPDVASAYMRLHELGVAHSVEVWWHGELAGGLYGLGLGRMVYGESMFARRSNASKIALCALIAWCLAEKLPAIDCQQVTRHLQSMGAAPISGTIFQELLENLVDQPPPVWRFEWSHLEALLTGMNP